MVKPAKGPTGPNGNRFNSPSKPVVKHSGPSAPGAKYSPTRRGK